MLFIKVSTVGVAPEGEEREQIPSIPQPPAGQEGLGAGRAGRNVSVCKPTGKSLVASAGTTSCIFCPAMEGSMTLPPQDHGLLWEL